MLSPRERRNAAAERYGSTAGATVKRVSNEAMDNDLGPCEDVVWIDETVLEVDVREIAWVTRCFSFA